MKNERRNTFKCRGKLQKMGVMYIHSPKIPCTSPYFPKKKFKKIAKIAKKGAARSLSNYGLQLTGNR
jgi:hypothetical protein